MQRRYNRRHSQVKKTTTVLTMPVPVLHDLLPAHYILHNLLSFVLNTSTTKMDPVSFSDTQESFPPAQQHQNPHQIKAENKIY
jgi:hypothetical protein